MKLALLVIGLAVLFAGLVLWKARAHEIRAEASYPPEGQLLDVDGVKVHAVVMGSGPDLVLIHGSSGNTRDMTFSLGPRLAERFRVIIFDRPGLGYTDRINGTGATIVQQAGLLVRAARQLGAERPIVMGHSYGGGVALAWAVHHPDAISALVPVASPSHPWTTPLDPLYRVTSHPFGSWLVVPVITAFVSDDYVARVLNSIFEPQTVPKGYSDHFGTGLSLRRVSMRANAAQRANLLDEIQALHAKYGTITVPTEIVHGTADTIVGLPVHAEKLVRDVPGAILTRLDGVGHMPHQVAQDAVVDAIERAATRAGLR